VPHALLAKEEVALLLFSFCFFACSSEREGEVPTVEVAPGASVVVRESERPSREREATPPELIWQSDVDAAHARARREGSALLVFVRASWSADSLRLERETWSDVRVRRAAHGLVLLRIDVSDPNAANETRMTRFGVNRVPAVVLFDRRDRRLGALEGPTEVDALLSLLAKAH
jgi:thiol:disulfide interchange protein